MPSARSSLSVWYRAALLAAVLVACSDGAATVPSDPGAYNPVGSAGSRGSSAGSGSFATGSTGGQPPSSPASGGSSGFTTTAPQGGSSALPGSGGSAVAGSIGRGAAGGAAVGGAGSFGNGGFGNGAFGGAGHGGAALGGAAGSLAGHAGALTQGNAGKQGAAGAPANVPATFAAVSSIIQANCAICHGTRMPRLTNGTSLYNTLTSTTVKECGGNALVKPNDPANSALLMLANWECNDLVMPQGCTTTPCLTDSELATISAWIDAGAPSN